MSWDIDARAAATWEALAAFIERDIERHGRKQYLADSVAVERVREHVRNRTWPGPLGEWNGAGGIIEPNRNTEHRDGRITGRAFLFRQIDPAPAEATMFPAGPLRIEGDGRITACPFLSTAERRAIERDGARRYRRYFPAGPSHPAHAGESQIVRASVTLQTTGGTTR